MALDEQVVQVFEALAAAGDARVRGDGLGRGAPGRGLGRVHLLQGLGEHLLHHLAVVGKARDAPQAQRAREDAQQHDARRDRQRQHPAQRRGHIGRKEQHAADAPADPAQLVLVGRVAPALVIPEGGGRNRQLAPRDKEGQEQAQPDRRARQQAEQQRKGQKAHHDLDQAVEVVRQRVGPGVHAQQDHGVVLIPRGVEQVGVQKRAQERQEDQDVRKGRLRGRLLVEDADPDDHRQKVQELAEEERPDLPQHGQDLAEDLQPRAGVEGVGQQALEQRDLLDRVKDGVDAVGVLQGKGEAQRLIHGRPPARPPAPRPAGRR